MKCRKNTYKKQSKLLLKPRIVITLSRRVSLKRGRKSRMKQVRKIQITMKQIQ